MLTIKNYIRAQSLDEAYELCQNKKNIILGGMLWLKMQSSNINTAIDLCDLNLNCIEENQQEYIIGASVSLRQLETNKSLNEYTNGAISEALKYIVGVQFRNTATVGGSVFGKYGFSDVSTVLLALNAKVKLHNAGIMSLEDFLDMKYTRDVLVSVIIPKQNQKIVYMSQRNTKTDFPVLTCGVSVIDNEYRCVIGATPNRATVVKGTDFTEPESFAQKMSEQFKFSDNARASAEYRKHICKVLITRSIQALDKENKLWK